MKPYELRLFRNDGTLVCAIPTDCADEKESRALFEQMKRKGFARVELWHNGACVFDSAVDMNSAIDSNSAVDNNSAVHRK